MHWVRVIIFVVLPLLLALAAPTLILWAWGNNWPLLPALLAGIMFLAAAVVVHLSGQIGRQPMDDAQQALWQELHALRRKVDAIAAGETGRAGAAGSMQQEDRQGETPHAQHDAAPDVPVASDTSAQQPSRREQAAALSRQPGSSDALRNDDHLAGFQLYMEPVVDMASGQTVMYRAHPALPAKGGRLYLDRQALVRARTLGRSGAMALRVLDGVLAFAHGLRARGASQGVICPLDVAVLAHEEVAERLQHLLGTEPHFREAAQATSLALVFNELAASSREARMHLMMLAQGVSGFIIEHEGVLSPDTPLPLPLPVRHVDVPGSALALAGGLSDMGTLAARYHERGWQVIAREVANEDMAHRVMPLAALARGPYFSPPRRVREEALAPRDANSTAGDGQQVPSTPSALRIVAAR